MLFTRIKNLLPKRVMDGVALKTLLSNIQLFRFEGLEGLNHNFVHSSKIFKLSFGGIFALFLSGYQPVLSMPPIQESKVYAQSAQEQTIDSTKLSQAFNLPHPGYLSTEFSSWHPGIDIATGLGMPIKPITSGKVVEVTMGFFGLGHYIVIEHEQGFRSTYGHMGQVYVKTGDLVNTGSFVGEVGMTGRTTGPHTHLEITKDGHYINPEAVLPAISNWPSQAGPAPKGQGTGEAQITPTQTKKAQTVKTEAKKPGIFLLESTTQPTKLTRLLLPLPGQSASQTAPSLY